MHTDPVCNMQIDEKKAAGKVNYNGKDYFFCSQECADEFRSSPQQYAKAA
jgi:YHS domain-containing protein